MVELDIEITDAIAVFERDLARARSRRIEKERAEAVLPIHPSPPKPQPSRSPNGGSGSLGSSPEIISKSEVPDTDVVMVGNNPDTGVHAGSEPAGDAPDTAPVAEAKATDSEVTATDTMPLDSRSVGLAIDLKPESTSAPKAPSSEKQPSLEQPQNDNFNISDIPDIPTTDMDFESMFDDLSAQGPTGGANGEVTDLNFDLDFPSGAFTNANETAVPNVDNGETFTANDQNAMTDQPSEDINTLLPGLENLVGDASGMGDIAMIDFPTTTASDSNGTANTAAQALPTSTQTATPALAGTSAQAPNNDTSTASEVAAMDNLFNFNTDASAEGGATGNENNLGDSTFDDLLGSDWANGGAGGSGEVKLTDFEDWFKDVS